MLIVRGVMLYIMPEIFLNTLKVSLLSGLFVFIALYCFAIYYLILCFIRCNTQVIWWYSYGITFVFHKQSFISSKYSNTATEVSHTSGSWLELLESLINQLTRPLYFFQHSKKYLRYTLKVLKTSLKKLKSSQKPSKAGEIYSTSLLFSMFQVYCHSFFNPNPTL